MAPAIVHWRSLSLFELEGKDGKFAEDALNVSSSSFFYSNCRSLLADTNDVVVRRPESRSQEHTGRRSLICWHDE